MSGLVLSLFPGIGLLDMACELQGLPEGFLSDCPLTSHGKRKVIGNGVPLPMGRAIARAVKSALLMEVA